MKRLNTILSGMVIATISLTGCGRETDNIVETSTETIASSVEQDKVTTISINLNQSEADEDMTDIDENEAVLDMYPRCEKNTDLNLNVITINNVMFDFSDEVSLANLLEQTNLEETIGITHIDDTDYTFDGAMYSITSDKEEMDRDAISIELDEEDNVKAICIDSFFMEHGELPIVFFEKITLSTTKTEIENLLGTGTVRDDDSILYSDGNHIFLIQYNEENINTVTYFCTE